MYFLRTSEAVLELHMVVHAAAAVLHCCGSLTPWNWFRSLRWTGACAALSEPPVLACPRLCSALCWYWLGIFFWNKISIISVTCASRQGLAFHALWRAVGHAKLLGSHAAHQLPTIHPGALHRRSMNIVTFLNVELPGRLLPERAPVHILIKLARTMHGCWSTNLPSSPLLSGHCVHIWPADFTSCENKLIRTLLKMLTLLFFIILTKLRHFSPPISVIESHSSPGSLTRDRVWSRCKHGRSCGALLRVGKNRHEMI